MQTVLPDAVEISGWRSVKKVFVRCQQALLHFRSVLIRQERVCGVFLFVAHSFSLW
jgi:hypothetical protein